MPQITSLAPTTETEAVNAMLAALGEAPIQDVDTATQADVQVALNTLREVARNVQAEGWQFNTDLALQLTPDGTLEWTDNDDETTELNVFLPPEALIRWELSNTSDQLGFQVALRPPKIYVADQVFYDRSLNRDGFDAEEVEYLYIDAIYAFDFEDLPQTVRAYITALAMRQFAESRGAADAVQYTNDDLRRAYRMLKRDQGNKDRKNLFNALGTNAFHGGRSRGFGGGFSPHESPNRAI